MPLRPPRSTVPSFQTLSLLLLLSGCSGGGGNAVTATCDPSLELDHTRCSGIEVERCNTEGEWVYESDGAPLICSDSGSLAECEAPPPCTEVGATECIDANLYTCNGVELRFTTSCDEECVKISSTEAQCQAAEGCGSAGETRCIGSVLQSCDGSSWNSDETCTAGCEMLSSQAQCTTLASSFAESASQWNIPANGEHDWKIADSYGRHAIMDINGDGKPDFVDSENQDTSDISEVWTSNQQPCWKVYLNNGNGFAAATTQWNIPANGEFDWKVSDSYGRHAVMDMDGDGKPDFVDSENQNTTDISEVWTSNQQPYWKVHLAE